MATVTVKFKTSASSFGSGKMDSAGLERIRYALQSSGYNTQVNYGGNWTGFTCLSGCEVVVTLYNVSGNPAAWAAIVNSIASGIVSIDQSSFSYWSTDASATPASTNNGNNTLSSNYTVKAGDSLSKIANLYKANGCNVTWQAIQSFNNLPSTVINIGQTLRIPCGNTSTVTPTNNNRQPSTNNQGNNYNGQPPSNKGALDQFADGLGVSKSTLIAGFIIIGAVLVVSKR